MTKFLLLSIVCVSFLCSQAQRIPLVAEEAKGQDTWLSTFSQPVQWRRWEIENDTVNGWKEWEMVENFSFGINRGTMPMIADLESLHPYFRDKVIELIRLCKLKGIELAVVETYRTHAKQTEYKSMGRRYTRSSAGRSRHQYGLAVDVVPMIDSIPQWRNIKLWRKIGPIGERLGLRWGGRWRRLFDPCHFEWAASIGTQNLAQGVFPTVPKPEHYPCLVEDMRELRRRWKAWELEQSTIARSSPQKHLRTILPSGKISTRGGAD